MGSGAKKKKVQNNLPQQSQKQKGKKSNKQTSDPPNHTQNKTGDKYVVSAGRPLQATKSSQHQRPHQETVHVNCNLRVIGRSPSRPTPKKHASVHQPQQLRNARNSRTETNNADSQVTQPRDNADDGPIGRKKRKRRSRKLLANEEEDQEKTYDKSQSNVVTSNHIETSQAASPIIYYAIRNGAYGYYGVHTDWNVCVRYLKGTPGATFKSFTDEEDAFQFAHGDYHQEIPSPREKKLKREEPHHAAKVNTQDSIEPRAENGPGRKVQPSREAKLSPSVSTRRRQQHQQATRMKPRPEVRSPSINGLIQRNPQPLPPNVEVDSIEIEDDSVDEAEETRICETNGKTQQVPSSEPSSEVQFVEDVSVHTVKVEPVLQPATLFSSEAKRVPVKTAKSVKTEAMLAKTGPLKNARKHLP